MTWKDHRFALLALSVWLAFAVHTACSTSVTHDEIWHLPAGLRAWSGDFQADRLNPPVSRLWAAWPVRLCGVTATKAVDASELGQQFVAEHQNFQTWYHVGRIANLIWPLAAAVLLYGWSWSAFGPATARLALLCFLLCPNVLAHGALVTPDAAAMAGFFATSFLLCRWMTVPTWRAALWLGVSLGLLQGIKFTGVVFAPVILIGGTWLIWRGSAADASLKTRGRLFGQLLVVIAVGLLFLCGTYGFHGCGFRWDALSLSSQSLRVWSARLVFFASLPMPLPADYVLGIDEQLRVMESPHPLFLDGVWQLSGFPSYYAKALGYKLSHGFQLACLAGLFATWRNRKLFDARRAFAIWGPLAILFVIASLSDMQLGLRYILPVVPALAMLAGRAAELLPAKAKSPASPGKLGTSRMSPGEAGLSLRALIAAALLFSLLSSLRFHPHHLAYFNEYSGGPVGGRYHLIDSNLDWGQDLWRARDFIVDNADENPRFLYFGTVDPNRIGIDAPLPPSRRPEPGLYLVSVNFVMGRPHSVLLPNGGRRSIDVHEFSYFRFFEPVARCGYSIDVYRITAEDIERVKSGETRVQSQR